MSSLNAWLIRIEETAARVLLAAIVVLVFLAALTRWFDYPIIWSIDIAQLFFGWICFLGADTALRLSRYFGLSEGFFLGLQLDYDLMQRRREIERDLKAIRPRAA